MGSLIPGFLNPSGLDNLGGGIFPNPTAPFTPASLPSPVAIYDPTFMSGTPAVGPFTTDGSAAPSSTGSKTLSIASNSSLQAGAGDFWLSAWAQAADTTTEYGIVGKWVNNAPQTFEYLIEFLGSPAKIGFQVGTTGNPEVSWGSTYSANTWYHVFAYYDSVNNLISLSVNNGNPVTLTTTGSITVGTAPVCIGGIAPTLDILNGLIDAAIFGKAPPGGIAAIASTIRSALYNSGNGLAAKDITATQKTAWGTISGWDMDGSGNLVTDYIGSNTLTNNNGVTFAAGQVATDTLLNNDAITDFASSIGGSGFTLAQATAANRPSYTTNINGSLPGLTFVPSNLLLKSFALAAPCTIWTVLKFVSNSNAKCVIGDVSTSAILWVPRGSTTWSLGTLNSGIAFDGNWHFFACVINDPNSYLVIDGTKGAVGTSGITNPGGLALGAQSNLGAASSMKITELGCNAVAFNDSAIAQLRAWCQANRGAP